MRFWWKSSWKSAHLWKYMLIGSLLSTSLPSPRILMTTCRFLSAYFFLTMHTEHAQLSWAADSILRLFFRNARLPCTYSCTPSTDPPVCAEFTVKAFASLRGGYGSLNKAVCAWLMKRTVFPAVLSGKTGFYQRLPPQYVQDFPASKTTTSRVYFCFLITISAFVFKGNPAFQKMGSFDSGRRRCRSTCSLNKTACSHKSKVALIQKIMHVSILFI